MSKAQLDIIGLAQQKKDEPAAVTTE